MQLRVLGPLELVAEDRLSGVTTDVPLRAARLRRLLAVFAVHRGSVVSTDRLADVVWGDTPPANAEAALHTLVFRLRAVLGPDAGVAVLTRAPGYVLDADRLAIDAGEFEDSVTRARSVLSTDPAHAAARLDRALALWRGPAYAEFADEDFVRAEAARLEELRVAAAEDRVDAALALDHPNDAVVRLEPLVVEHPLRERPHAQLVLALYRGGRHADALEVYRRYRQRLDEELGLQPSPALRRLEADVLRQDPALAPSAAAPSGSSAAAPSGSSAAAPVAAASSAAVASIKRRAGGALPANPPVLIGRAEALAGLREVLRSASVVTLTGPGGVGKTTLAVHLAVTADTLAYPDGVWLVELAALTDADAVPLAVSGILSVQQRHETSVTQRLVEYLRPRRLLLVLDNCEHVVDAVAAMVDSVARDCPGVTILATSREPLGVDGERVRPVPPLPVPPRGATDAAGAASVELFVARAVAAAGEFTVTDATAEAVGEICRRLDGIPLAIELAASRMRSATPVELVDRLDRRFHLLRSTRRLAAERHRTLRAVVDWSYALLSEEERRVFDALSAFAGGFRLAAAETVVAATMATPAGGEPIPDVAEILDGLVSKSMLLATPGADPDGSTRYRLLETLRAYGRERLDEQGLADRVRRAHAEYYAGAVARAGELLQGPQVVPAIDAIARDFDELRSGHGWALVNDLGLANRLVAALVDYVELRMPAEVFRWADQTIEATEPRPDPVVLVVAASGARFGGDLKRAENLADRALAAAPEGDRCRAYALFILLEVALFQGRTRDSERLAAKLEPVARAAGDVLRAMFALIIRVLTHAYAGDLAMAIDLAARCRAEGERTGSPLVIAWCRYAEGEVRLDTDSDGALLLLDDALALAREVGDRYLTGVVLVSLASVRARNGDPAAARVTFVEAIEHWHRAGDWTHQWVTLRGVVQLLLRTGADEPAAVLHGAVTGRATAARVYGADAQRLDQARRVLVDRLGPERFAAAAARGVAMSDEEVVGVARAALASPLRGPGGR